ncbi:DUF423 domain-containing protein [Flavobacterium psychrotolerans]|nr:DUF423 domain-containing protein [Flavobacterium psychrotolerans]
MISIAALLGMVAIILGAFGAHALKKVLSLEQLNIFETGVKYQMYHALFLLFTGTSHLISENAKRAILNLVVIGVLFFSGSIYLLATDDLTTFDFRIIGFVTPIGGAFLIAAWFLCLYHSVKKSAGKN